MEAATFTPPSPGSWEVEATHLQRPITRWLGALYGPNMMRGFKEGSARYGVLLDHLEVAVIGGFIYMAPRPVGAPKTAKGPPPKLIFKLLTKLHPELRRRIKRSKEMFETKLWREDVALWDTDWKPAVRERHAELAAIDPSAIDGEALVAHLRDLEARVAESIYQHHRLNMCALIPVGDFLAQVSAWTGRDAKELCALLRGMSPVSTGATEELERATAAIRGDAEAAALLASAKPADEILRSLGARSDAVRAYLAIVGNRMPGGYDVCEPCMSELPELLLGTLRVGTASKHDSARVEADTQKIREAVPAEHRAAFDELLAEAKYVYRIRDERTYWNDTVASGLARRALLAAGDKLVAAGKLRARDHAVDLAPNELYDLLAGKPGPTADEVAGRITYRTSHTTEDVPATLGFPPSAPPPAEWLPPYAARAMRAVNIVLEAMFAVREKAKPEPKLIRGLPASPGQYEGRARVVRGADEFGKVQQGDVLIARNTCPSYNVLLPLLGGIVTDRGGLLSHAAIVAREYGMPAVVGTTDATAAVPDGARVRVDGATGEVRVLS